MFSENRFRVFKLLDTTGTLKVFLLVCHFWQRSVLELTAYVLVCGSRRYKLLGYRIIFGNEETHESKGEKPSVLKRYNIK